MGYISFLVYANYMRSDFIDLGSKAITATVIQSVLELRVLKTAYYHRGVNSQYIRY